jgi:hypothetical protein
VISRYLPGHTEEGYKELTRRDRDLNPGPPQSGVAVPAPWLQYMVVVMNSAWTTSVHYLTHTRALHLVTSCLALTILIGIVSYNGEVTTMFVERLQFNTSLYFWFDIESGQVCSISEFTGLSKWFSREHWCSSELLFKSHGILTLRVLQATLDLSFTCFSLSLCECQDSSLT